jgi:hypothetical protein
LSSAITAYKKEEGFTTTPTNLEWKIKALIREVRKDHEYYVPRTWFAPDTAPMKDCGPGDLPHSHVSFFMLY